MNARGQKPPEGAFRARFPTASLRLPLKTIPQFSSQMYYNPLNASLLDGFSPDLLTFYRLGAPHCEQGQRQSSGLCQPLGCLGEEIRDSQPGEWGTGWIQVPPVSCMRGGSVGILQPRRDPFGARLVGGLCKRWEVGLY